MREEIIRKQAEAMPRGALHEVAAPAEGGRPIVLLAEDDDDDYRLLQEAFQETGTELRLRRVTDGEELMESLLDGSTLPSLILLDLNMPRKSGREALSEIRAHPILKGLPVIVLTTSESEEDMSQMYAVGVSSFIKKPPTFDRLVELVKTLKRYWFDTVLLPPAFLKSVL
jgi:CheY-like chemotaxis protein